MAINLFLAKTFDGVTTGVLNALKKNMLDKNAKHIVIVPEKFTLTGEKIIFDKLGISGADNLTITSFSRLAEKNVDTKKKCLTSAGSLMLFTKAVLKVGDKLTKYKNCKRITGFYKEMYSVISLLRNSGIKIEDLDCLNLPNITKLKIEDITILYNSYIQLLSEEYYDATSLFEQFCDVISDKGLFSDSHIYILDYYFFSKVQCDIIEQMVHYAKSVNIALPYNQYAKNERIFPSHTIDTLDRIAKNSGNKLNKIVTDTRLLPEFNHIVDNLFGYENCDKMATNNIQIFANENIEKEVEFACIEIKKHIFSGDYRYKDFAIVVGSIADYAPIIKKLFVCYDIPFFIDKKEPMLLQAGTRFLLDSLKAVNSNFDKDYILKLALNPYSGISKEAYSDFENYIVKFGINHSIFLKSFEIAKDDTIYLNAENTRKTIVDRLKVLTEKQTNSEYIQMVKNYLTDCNFLDRTNAFIDGQIEYHNEFYCSITSQMYDKIYAVLDEYDDILGKENSTLDEFSLTLENMLADIEIGLVPFYVDSVYIGEATESMYEGVKVMLILGANQGVMPLTQTDAPILSNSDIDMFLHNNIVIEPTPKQNNTDAMFYITELMVTPSEKLMVSYNEAKGSGPAEIIRELQELFDIDIVRPNYDIGDIYAKFGEDGLKKELPHIIATENNMKNLLIRDICGQKDRIAIKKPYNSMFFVLEETDKNKVNNYVTRQDKVYKINNGDKLFFNKNYTYVSQLERYFSCPYSHFMDYGLGLKDREEHDITNLDIGNIIHAVLEHYFKKLADYDIADKDIHSMVSQLVDEELADEKYSTIDKNNEILLKKIKKECIVTCKELTIRLRYSKFRPYRLELAFGKNNVDAIKINAEGKEIKFIGKIDRVDKYQDRIIVIDYKTGKSFSKNFADIYTGRKIQLFLYLSALLNQHKDLHPAGVYYLPINIKYADDGISNRFNYVGFTTSSLDVIKDIDYSITNGKSVLIAGLKTKKNGELDVNSQANTLSDKEFNAICKYVTEISRDACREILEGNIIASPYDNSCSYCKYAEVCGYSLNTSRKVSDIDKYTIIGSVDDATTDSIDDTASDNE